jgi:hypothetical protein
MRVEMDRQVGRVLQRLEQYPRRLRLQQPRHVLDGDDIGAGFFQLGGKRRIVLEVVFRAGGIQNVAGIADRRLADPVLLGDRVHRDAHVLDPVQAVEDAEDVDAALGRLADEVFDDIIRIVLVADAIGPAEQHL